MSKGFFGSGTLRQTFSSLRHRDYMLFWIGTVISHSGDWMDQIAFNWLVLEISNSPLSLGLVNLCRAIPIILLVPLGGVAADHWARRKILMVTQSMAMLLAFILGVLITTNVINIWEIYVIAALRGAVMSFNMPARQSLIPNLVPKNDLPNAIALTSATGNLTRVIGPSVGGILIALLGIDWLFYLNGLSFLAILYTLHLMKDTQIGGSMSKSHPWQEFKEGVVFLRSNKLLLYLTLLAVVPMFFGQPYLTMLAVFARNVLRIGPAGLGLLTSTAAAGSIAGALIIAGSSRTPRISIMLWEIIFFGFALLMFSLSSWLSASLILLFFVGASNIAYNATNNTLLQLNIPDRYRGRILSVLFINRGIIPLGTAVMGLLAEKFGAPVALGSMAVVLILIGILAYFTRPKNSSLKSNNA
jgi:MFS transporter, DHA1 family, staphyloferrin A biosynthesis exporter